MKRDNLEEVFSPLKSYSSAPPPELWDAIESRLEKPKKKKRAIIWWYVAAGMAVGLLIPSVYLATRLDHLNKKNNVVLHYFF